MNFVKAHWAWIASAASGVVLFITPSVTAWVATHPSYAVSVGTVWAVAAAWAKSPKS